MSVFISGTGVLLRESKDLRLWTGRKELLKAILICGWAVDSSEGTHHSAKFWTRYDVQGVLRKIVDGGPKLSK